MDQNKMDTLITTLLVTAGEPCSCPEIEDHLKGMGGDTFDVRDAIHRLIAKDVATFTPDRRVKVHNSVVTQSDDRVHLEDILAQRAAQDLFAAGKRLLLSKKYHLVVEIVDLLEELGKAYSAQRLREAMVASGGIKPEEVSPY